MKMHLELKKEDFILVLMNEAQGEMMLKNYESHALIGIVARIVMILN